MRNSGIIRAAAVGTAALGLWFGQAAAAPSKIAPDLASRLDVGGSQRVIITYHTAADANGRSAIFAREGRGRELSGARAVLATVCPDEVRELAADPAVESISPDRPVRGASEAAFDPEYAKALGAPMERIDLNDSLVTVEDFYEDMLTVIDKAKGPSLYILDSLDALSDRAEMSRNLDEGTYGAGKAKQLSQVFRRSAANMAKANVTLMVISQVRDAIDVMFGRKFKRSGGRAMDFYASRDFDKIVRWDIFASKIGLVPFPKDFLSIFLKDITQERIEEISALFYQQFKDWALYAKGRYGLKQCIETLEDYMKASGVESDHRIIGNDHKYIIRHDLGIHWSFFGANLLKNLFSDFVPEKKVEFTTSNSTLTATISLGKGFSEHDYDEKNAANNEDLEQ